MLAAPFDLSVMYDVDGLNPWPAATVATVAWALVTWLVWRVRHTRPVVAWAYGTWWLLLFPVLNIFPITTLMNDRYLYLPCILVFAGTGAAVETMARRMQPGSQWPSVLLRAVAAIGAGVLVAGSMSYTAMSMRYVQVWRNPVTLWAHALDCSPRLPVVQIQWALTLHAQGETERACQVLEDVLSEARADEGDRLRIARILSEWRAGSTT
jgi:hypothetical protein